MAATMELESTLTDRYQTTVPDAVRRALKLGKRDKIRYVVGPNGRVMITRAAGAEANDPALGAFLHFLANDIEAHPQRVKSVDAKLIKRIQSLVRGVTVDLDAPLSPADE